MKRVWFLVLAASVGLNAALLWQQLGPSRGGAPPSRFERAWDGAPGRGPGGERDPGRRGGEPRSWAEMQQFRLERVARRLDLDGAQLERLRAVALAPAAEMDSLRAAARIERGLIRDLLGRPEIDAGAVREAAQRLRTIEARIETRVTENLILEAGILEPGQRRAFLDLMRFAGPPGARRPR
jgi:hypothetical protein